MREKPMEEKKFQNTFGTDDMPDYIQPSMEKHEPVKIVQGSGSCGYLYYVTLYYY